MVTPPAPEPGPGDRARRSGALEMRVQLALEHVASALGDSTLRASAMASGDQLTELIGPAIAGLSERLREPGPRLGRARIAELSGQLVELHALRDELRERRLVRHMQSLTSVQEGISRLRACRTLPELVEGVCEEACRSCQFDRAALFRVDGSELVATSAHARGGSGTSDALLELGRTHRPQLTHLLLETEMYRRRQPALVDDPRNDARTYKPFVEASATEAYVAAPIIPDDRVIGFLHADTRLTRRPLDELDRDILWSFARGFGHTVERIILRDRLDAQRQQVRRMITSTEAVMGEMSIVSVDLSPDHAAMAALADDAPMARAATSMFMAPESRIETLLTKREREVLGLMAAGHTNAAIAERLVISHGTVKSHVKHILRKLRAANRAEAVSRYLRLSTQPELDGG